MDTQPFHYRGCIIEPAWVGYAWHHPPTHDVDWNGDNYVESGGGGRDTIAQCQEEIDEYIDELEADAALADDSDVAQIQREAFGGEAD